MFKAALCEGQSHIKTLILRTEVATRNCLFPALGFKEYRSWNHNYVQVE